METEGLIVLEDGTWFRGRPFGANGEALGEIVFNTSLTGYQEILTDPSYAEQIVAMTYPEIGNIGVNREDVESARPHVRGFLVREYTPVPSNWRAERPLGDYLQENGVVALEGVDTRRLVLRIRSQGAMRAVLSTEDLDVGSLLEKVRRYPGLVGRDLVRDVTTPASYTWEEGIPGRFSPFSADSHGSLQNNREKGRRTYHVVAYDFGAKWNIWRSLVEQGCRLTVVPATCPSREVLDLQPDGVILSNGPGDPAGVDGVRENIDTLMGRGIPIFGICLGHQILALAAGGKTFKLKFGHRGANQPVKDLQTGKVEITSHNHGYAVDGGSLGGSGFEVSHINLNDGTVEGLVHRELPVFSVQYHPEASPGPHDASYLFRRFLALMEHCSAAAR